MLRLSSSDWFGSHVLAPVLAEFGRLHLRVCIELLKRKGLLFNALGVNQDDVAFIRQNKALRCALEEGVTHGAFQRTKATSHCWLGLAEAARGAAERPFARDRQEDSEIAPLHRQ